MRQKIINFVFFQIGWFACVLGATKQMPWLGVGFLVIFIVWHISQAKQPTLEIVLLLIAVLIGGVYDQIMRHFNLLTYQSHGWSTALPAAWILALWAEFAMTLNVSLAWLKKRYVIATLFGAIGGPLAYVAAEKLGAVTINSLPASYIALALGWAIITPILVFLSLKLDGFKA